MANVVLLRRHSVVDAGADAPGLSGLIDLFARRRRGRHDPFWLKENAEIVQIMAARGLRPTDATLAPLVDELNAIEDDLLFFPQYYRLLLSLALDLRDLGLHDVPVQAMADLIHRRALISGETSDMHRAEVLLLLQRAGYDWAQEAALEARLRAFAENAPGFCLPNRRAAYDLTHIVFHAADYGRRPFLDGAKVADSLINVGMVAWLEDNADLLAEVTLALRMAGQPIPPIWHDAVLARARDVRFESATHLSLDDDYHQYLVLNWAVMAAGLPGFVAPVPIEARIIRQRPRAQMPLAEISQALLSMGRSRSADWPQMRWRLWSLLSPESRARIEALETMPQFEAFFAGFARPPGPSASPNLKGEK